jgi:acyl-coenzyme A synthetase/AMP-(fatty) acid ligase
MNNSVVFAGFATNLATRIFFAQAQLVITADATMRAGKFVQAVVEGKHLGDLSRLKDRYTENQKV